MGKFSGANKKKMKPRVILIFAGLLLLAFGAISLLSKSSTPVPQSAVTKVMPPLEVKLAVEGKKLFIGGNFPLVISFTPQENMHLVIAQVQASGNLSVSGFTNLVWNKLASGQEITNKGSLHIDGPGDAEIKASITVLDSIGDTLYGRSSTLYFLITADEVFTGTSSPLLLKREFLEKELRAGRITRKQYQKALEELLGGGATETYDISPKKK
jgi:hypothetical protein